MWNKRVRRVYVDGRVEERGLDCDLVRVVRQKKRGKNNKRLLYSLGNECNYKHSDPVKAS